MVVVGEFRTARTIPSFYEDPDQRSSEKVFLAYPICERRLTQRAKAKSSSSPENKDEVPTSSADRP